MRILSLLGRKPGDGERTASADFKRRLGELGLFAPDVAFAVNEIVCADPACPGTETVILVMEPGKRTWAIKIPAEMSDVTDDALTVAVQEALANRALS